MTKPVSTATGGSFETVQQIFYESNLSKGARACARRRTRAIKKAIPPVLEKRAGPSSRGAPSRSPKLGIERAHLVSTTELRITVEEALKAWQMQQQCGIPSAGAKQALRRLGVIKARPPDAMSVSAPSRENRPQQRFGLIDATPQATGSSTKASHPSPGLRGPDGGAPRWSASPSWTEPVRDDSNPNDYPD